MKKKFENRRRAFRDSLRRKALFFAKQDGRDKLSSRDMYRAYLLTPEWKAKRDARLEEAGGLCLLCAAAATAAHHMRYPKRLGDERPKDLLPVCGRCHLACHGHADGSRCAFCGNPGDVRHRIKHPKIIDGKEPEESVPACRRCDSLTRNGPSCHEAAQLSKKQRRQEREKRQEATESKALLAEIRDPMTIKRLLDDARRRKAVEQIKREERRL